MLLKWENSLEFHCTSILIIIRGIAGEKKGDLETLI
jgi:hypothetical protein